MGFKVAIQAFVHDILAETIGNNLLSADIDDINTVVILRVGFILFPESIETITEFFVNHIYILVST